MEQNHELFWFDRICDLLGEILEADEIGRWFTSPHPRLQDKTPGEFIAINPEFLLVVARRDLNKLHVTAATAANKES